MSKISPVPPGHSPLVPMLAIKSCAKAIAFYKEAFGATEDFRLVEASGKVGHAELRIGGALISVSDEYPDFGCLSPASVGGNPVKFQLYVADVDAAIDRAVRAGGTLVRPLRDEFYGDRTATVADPFGYSWQLSSRIQDVSPAEMQALWDKAMAGAA
ncbi:MAG: VOC family protein [Hyphomicrobium sp.]|nr:VOC family protein [Hyphomicrobium sp.]